jgi:hypothetical protein
MELLAVKRSSADTLELTLADGVGLWHFEASEGELAALCDAMEQAAVLAAASERSAWLAAVPVGEAVVRLGIGGGRVRMVVGPR